MKAVRNVGWTMVDAAGGFLDLFAKALPKPKKPTPKVPGGQLTEDPSDEPPEETQEQRDERHRFLVVWFKRLRADVEYRVEQLTEQLADGTLDSRRWAAAFRRELADAHTEAHVIGRRLAGHVGPFTDTDRAAGDAAWQRQEEYFAKFLADVESGRYSKPPENQGEGDSLNEPAFNARAIQYVSATRGTVHESFRIALGKEPTDWNLGAGDHCKPSNSFPFNCPDLADESPKPADEWPTAPARGECPCRGNCTCWLSTSDGSHSTEGI